MCRSLRLLEAGMRVSTSAHLNTTQPGCLDLDTTRREAPPADGHHHDNADPALLNRTPHTDPHPPSKNTQSSSFATTSVEGISPCGTHGASKTHVMSSFTDQRLCKRRCNGQHQERRGVVVYQRWYVPLDNYSFPWTAVRFFLSLMRHQGCDVRHTSSCMQIKYLPRWDTDRYPSSNS